MLLQPADPPAGIAPHRLEQVERGRRDVNTLRLRDRLVVLAAPRDESHVMPPPTPYSAVPVSASTTTVRIATLNDAPADRCAGARKPTAPQ